jgi:hypothetical protein
MVTTIYWLKAKQSLCMTQSYIGGKEVELHSFLTLAPDGGEWSDSRPSHCHQGRTPVLIENEAGQVLGLVWMCRIREKCLAPVRHATHFSLPTER